MYFLNLIYLFFIRDLKIYLSYKFNLVIQVGFVLIILVFLNLLFLSQGTDIIDSNSSNIGKLLIGIALIDFMISCISVFNREVRNAQQFGTFEILFQSNVPIYLVMIASYSFTFFKTATRVLVYILISSIIFNININYSNIPIFIFLMIFFSLPYIGIGMISASFIIYFKQGNFINLFVSIISIFSSGIFFSIDALPSNFQWLSEFNPLSNAVNLITSTVLEAENASIALKMWGSYKSTFLQICLFIPLGIILVYYSFKASKMNGSLNHY